MQFQDVYDELLVLVSTAGARPDVPIESAQFFTKLVEDFSGSKEDFLQYVADHLIIWFRFVDQPPKWIQDAVWQFSNGKPMVFIGQVNVPATQTGMFHDDAAFYIFWQPDGDEIKTILQVS